MILVTYLNVEEDVSIQFKVTEEKRLAVTVHQIDEEASVVPRGAFIRSPSGPVQINRSFSGEVTVFPVRCASP